MKLSRRLMARILACGLCCLAVAAHGDTDTDHALRCV